MTIAAEVRVADVADADAIGQLLHIFNSEFNEPTPGPQAVAARVRKLLAAGDITVLLAGAGPHGLAVLRFPPSLWKDAQQCSWKSSTSSPIGAAKGWGGR
jgi:hypothetical protein